MPAGAVIGALRVILGADTAAFEKSMSTAEKRAEAFGRKIGIGLKAAAAAGVAAGAALTVAIKGTLDEADRLTKMAQSIGVPVEELSRLKHAADLSGVSLESLGNAVGRLSRNMQDASDGLATPNRAFDQLGINIKNSEGQLKSMSDILPEVAERFAAMEDGTEKTALSMILFGRSGRELIPLLNQGAAGINAMTKEADALGIVITERTGRAAEQFNDNLTRLHRVFDGLITQVTANLAPGLARLSDLLVGLAVDGDRTRAIADGITAAFRFVAKEVASTVLFFQRFGAEVAALFEVVKTLRSPGEFFFGSSDAWAQFRAEGEITEEMFASLRLTIDNLFASTSGLGQQMSDTFGLTLPAAASSAVTAIDSVKASAEAAAAAGEKVGPTLAKSAQITSDSYLSAASSIGGSLSSIFGESKAAAIASAIINVAEGVTKALSAYPPPLSFAMAAAQAAAGAAQIATIKSAKFHSGGSFTVPGPVGTEMPTSFTALAGERVTVDPIGGGGGGGGGTLTIEGVRPDFFYRGDRIRDMVTAFQEHVSNGGKWVKLA